ncbi:MAG: hypothetical protein WB714_20725 [Candidatus Sulfotelmatobacter sp.]
MMNLPGQQAPVQPVLQRQDGNFIGTVSTSAGSSMIGFTLSGSSLFNVLNDTPQIATSDNGVIGASGTTYDQGGNATGQLGTLPTYSWKGAYIDGPVQSVADPLTNVATTIGSFFGGSPTGGRTAVPVNSIELFWCGISSRFSGTCSPSTDLGMNYFSAMQPYPGIDFTARYPNWADVVQTNALGALKAAFSKIPVLVESASAYLDHVVFVTGFFDRSQNPQSGHTQEGTHYSYLNYGNILVGALTALNIQTAQTAVPYPPQTQSQVAQFEALMAALGKGIGNVAAHELGHQWILPQMDCDGSGPPCPSGIGNDTYYYEYFNDSASSDYLNSGPPKQWTARDVLCLTEKLDGVPNPPDCPQ